MSEFNQKIFSVKSKMDLGIDILLDEEGYSHIIQGHPSLSRFVVGIQEVVEFPTQVYTSSYDPRRLQFTSTNVQNKYGHLITVIVQLKPDGGQIITASPKGKIKGSSIWSADSEFRVTYDARSDVLYFSTNSSEEAYADEADDDDRVWLRFRESDNKHFGVTVFQARKIWASSASNIIDRVSSFLSLDQAYVRDRINAYLRP